MGSRTRWMVGLAAALCATLQASEARAHCDTLEGPVVKDARAALSKGDVTAVLKWVKKDREPELRGAFDLALTVRSKGTQARELADRYFFETLVRIHRAGEGAPYTGLKASPPEPVIAKADQALKQGSVEPLSKAVAQEVAKGIRERFERAARAQKKVDSSVAAGREFVEAYVQYTHYLEAVHGLVAGHGEGHAGSGTKAPAGKAARPAKHAKHEH